MTKYSPYRAALCAAAAAAVIAALAAPPAAVAQEATYSFDIPAQEVGPALLAFGRASRQQLVFDGAAVRGKRSAPLQGDYSTQEGLERLLEGTGLRAEYDGGGAVRIVSTQAPQGGGAAGNAVQALIVTAQKREEDIQDVPIAISAFSQEDLTQRQVAGGPDLITQVPNLSFTKTNFASYSIQIRGIGTQAISVGTDPAVAVAFNGVPFIRNHFFEQEFYDVAGVEILRGPQGTLFGRNATAGVVNVRSAPPVYRYEAKASGDLGNYDNRRLEGMVNVPLIEDKLALRVAGEWTKRDGYSYNETTNRPTDGRDLWSTRASLRMDPVSWIRVNAIWEHFEEDDDRIRSAKQLCKKDPGPETLDGGLIADIPNFPFSAFTPGHFSRATRAWLTQGCLPTSLYSDEAFQTPNGQAIPFVALGMFIANANTDDDGYIQNLLNPIEPYAGTTQSRDLRVFQSANDPSYHAKNDTYELNLDVDLGEGLTLTSQTGFSSDEIRSTQDFNRFNTAPGIFKEDVSYYYTLPDGSRATPIQPGGVYCDPQLGCSTSMVAGDLSKAWGKQFSQEIRLASDFEGSVNFSVGANFLRYKTLEDYYVFFNLLTAQIQYINGSGPGQYDMCRTDFSGAWEPISPEPVLSPDGGSYPFTFGCVVGQSGLGGTYIDPHPINELDGLGHNYFRSKNPYRLTSKAVFGELYYQMTPALKLTAGLRWTSDRKRSAVVPSQTAVIGGGYPEVGVIDQEWAETTGRFVVDWTPDIAFTDSTMAYASYARGYKAGGANPPGPTPGFFSFPSAATHPQTFDPEFVDAFEVGAKNVLMDGALTLNVNAFYYDYEGYQISQIVDRTSINLNFDTTIKGLELEGSWQQSEALRFNFAAGLQDTSVKKGQSAIDIMDRTAGNEGWIVVKPFFTDTSNCVLPEAAFRKMVGFSVDTGALLLGFPLACGVYSANPFAAEFLSAIMQFDPATAPNGGAGFSKDLGGNQLPNAPQFTTSLGAQYSLPLPNDWLATFRADGYWAGNSYARIFNDEPYDKLRHRTNLNLAAILTGGDGWQIIGYVKNVFDDDFITGAFLNSDDTALTTNIFLNEPRLFGVRVTKEW